MIPHERIGALAINSACAVWIPIGNWSKITPQLVIGLLGWDLIDDQRAHHSADALILTRNP